MVRKYYIFILVLLFSLILRLGIIDKAWHVDILSNAGWGEWIFEHGPKNFYQNSIWTYAWPTQLPLMNSVYAWDKKLSIEILGRMAWIDFQLNKVLPGEKVWWLTDFVKYFGFGTVNLEIPFQIGYLMSIKLLPILADVIIGLLLYWETRKKWITTVYLLSPFSWYISAGWGQYDSVGFGLVFLGLILLKKPKWLWAAPLLMALGVLIKPTSLILAPIILYYYLTKNRGLWWGKLLGIALAIVGFWVTTAPYTHKNPIEFGWYDLKRIAFEKAEPRVSSNAFNFWRIIIGDRAVNANTKYLGISANIWGLMIFGIINIWAIKKLGYWESLFAVSAGGFMFMTGMLDRYLYAGMVLGLLVIAKRPKTLGLWIGWSLIFWLNLYNQWWVPYSFEPLKILLTTNDALVTRILSLISVLLFFKLLRR